MIRTKKTTPLAYGYRITSRQPPQPELTIIVRGKFVCKPGQPCELLRTAIGSPDDKADLPADALEALEEGEYLLGQGPLTADVYADDDADRAGPVEYPSDFAEFKIKTDVMLKGTCHPPSGSATSTLVTFGVGERFEKSLRISGPRVWVDKILGGEHTDPLSFQRLPVDWAHAFGGPEFADNPAGKGFKSDELPNVEAPDRPLRRAGQQPTPAGFGPINPEWPLRRNKRGRKYGPEYEKTRAPWYSEDYDWTAQNAAPPDQQLDGYLRGDERVRFVNLHPESADFSVTLPALRPRAFAKLTDGRTPEAPLVCDTLFVDLDDEVLYLTWRGHVQVQEDDLSDVALLYIAHEDGRTAPRPAEEYLAELEAFAADPIGFASSPAAKLADFEDKLESGELERKLDELAPDEEPVTTVFGGVLGVAPDSDKIIAQLRESMDKTQQQPGARDKVIEQLRNKLRELREGGAGGPTIHVDTRDGNKIAAGPFMRNVLRQVADAQKDAVASGADMDCANEALQDELSKVEGLGLTEEDLRLPAPDEPLPEPAPNVDFSGHDLSERDFSGLDLSGCTFEGTGLRRTSFRGATLRGASFLGSVLATTDFSDADCTDANFSMAHFVRTVARDANLRGAKLDLSHVIRADLTGANLTAVTGQTVVFHKSVLDRAVLEEVDLHKVFVDECSLEQVRLTKARLSGGMFRKSNLSGARFDGADLSNGGFLECDLRRTVFRQALGDTTSLKDCDLEAADFSYAIFPRAIFLGVDAKRATFVAADMPEARFYRAVLRESRFDQANLLMADMRKTSLTKACFRRANCYRTAFIEAFGTDADFRDANLEMANFKRNQLVTR
ncbi:MAG: DUF2169 domain-containing protein [Deltaproteobacteria bacterium]|jgi:uncharacterized protein YjbI with pentapeptide repeats|nr:DUF2169 domain-containing protein [Deltaproteobacteria bacterium]MBW2531481.1 DUF2169 domain-containing protein [Deltaproteobacteria bacterium]